jgi:hypothetical protein
MKNKWMILAAALALSAITTVQATPITGVVTMGGTAILNNTVLGSATGVTAFSGVTVNSPATGIYAGLIGSAVTWSGFTWNPSSAPVTPLWQFTVAGETYSFNLGAITSVSQGANFVNLIGTGTLMATGNVNYDATPGAWTFTINDANGTDPNMQFGFSNNQNPTPDGGATVMLLGAALTGLGLLRRKLIA